MPTYGYRCESCGNEFDVRQRMSDEAGADCPKCGRAARRLFFPAGIVFKGTGFYKTDSRKASAGDSKAASSSSSSESKTATSSPSSPSTTSSTPGGD